MILPVFVVAVTLCHWSLWGLCSSCPLLPSVWNNVHVSYWISALQLVVCTFLCILPAAVWAGYHSPHFKMGDAVMQRDWAETPSILQPVSGEPGCVPKSVQSHPSPYSAHQLLPDFLAADDTSFPWPNYLCVLREMTYPGSCNKEETKLQDHWIHFQAGTISTALNVLGLVTMSMC